MNSLTMPIKEAMKVIKDIMHEPIFEADLYCAETYYGYGDLVFPDMEDYAFNTALLALEKADKYSWHEEKDDIPINEGIEILRIYTNISSNKKTYIYDVGLLSDYEEFCNTDDDYICDIDEIDYWRYHEGFNKE